MHSTPAEARTNSIVDDGHEARINWVVACGERYWPDGRGELVAALPQQPTSWTASRRCEMVELPLWAVEAGVGAPAALLVDRAAIASGDGPAFDRCNWFAAAFMFLTGAQEGEASENSYSGAVGDTDPRLFERAWVNRYMLLLRKLAARHASRPEHELFGAIPKSEIDLTHDVDAVRKTLEIRLKQSAFFGFNAARSALKGEWRSARQKAMHGIRFFTTTPSYQTIEPMRRMEAEAGLRSTFHVYGGPPGLRRLSPLRMLLDPGYDAGSTDLRDQWRGLLEGGWQIGVHPSFQSSSDPERIGREREAVERACGRPVTRCRQHWLRFTWADTWRAQSRAGLQLDTTLGFNDRPAFRNGAALCFRPWDAEAGAARPIHALPMVFMDSHFYDYRSIAASERKTAMRYWIDELRAVGGIGSVNWHPHTLSEDYGWKEGFRDLLDLIS
ncbi:hypothetical protein KMZ29_09540 [Bradyrhizobium sediminis]|uniref:Uncharacterized protein n=1 Tax=Bradyrhizobium sediminis TaxID=2840469 RepID=A0A975NHE6_9BRAD|nr:hypothetical protein [Bradyrhizobium sediminis]QWG14870.1 hypothetical protein KMZ29_09540 [Bradyrhizobium sediminis]